MSNLELVKVGHISHMSFEIGSFQKWSGSSCDIETLEN